MVMKGISSIIAVVMILMIVVLVIVTSNVVFVWEEGTMKEANIQATTYTMWNSLRAAELYMNLSLDYSVYQACYDTLRWGGFDKDNKNWSNYYGGAEHGDILPTDQQFKDTFDRFLRLYVGRYTTLPYGFVENYNVMSQGSVSLPEIEITSVGMETMGISVSARSQDLYIRKILGEFMEEVVLTKGFSVNKWYDIPCIGLFGWGKLQQIDSPEFEEKSIKTLLRDAVNEEMEKWPSRNDKVKPRAGDCTKTVEDEMFYELAGSLLTSSDPPYYTPSSPPSTGPAWKDAVLNGQKKIEENIRSAVFNAVFDKNSDNYLYVIIPEPEVSVKITPQCQGEGGSNSCTCTRFDYDVTVVLRTNIMENWRTMQVKYYPIANDTYPRLDRMQLVMTDRLVYKK